ncbi:hypothetical protein CTA2_1754, partial [Colletotrichum tanaceti]
PPSSHTRREKEEKQKRKKKALPNPGRVRDPLLALATSGLVQVSLPPPRDSKIFPIHQPVGLCIVVELIPLHCPTCSSGKSAPCRSTSTPTPPTNLATCILNTPTSRICLVGTNTHSSSMERRLIRARPLSTTSPLRCSLR